MSEPMLHQSIERYAETILRIGLNLQHGQNLIIEAPIQAAAFVRIVTEYAYKLGAAQVHYEWSDDELTLIRHRFAPMTSLGYYPDWKTKGLEQYARDNAAVLFIQAPNPDLLREIPLERTALELRGRSAIRRPFLEYTHHNKISWAIVNVPSVTWAAKIFPEHQEDEAITKLWDVILQAARIYDNDPIKSWRDHIDRLQARTDQLNVLRIHKLHYRASGTDLIIELPEQHKWLFGARPNSSGIPFVSNMPTEEVFTMPAKDGVNGTVRSTKPLNFNGTLIEDFSLTFKNGKIEAFSAAKGEELLKTILETDEGSCFLGEVALVPYHSPISMMNIIFYNTLFDENASCHLALGQSFPDNIIGGASMSSQELSLHGANNSMIHIDFMIGSPELDIDAELIDGSTIPLFRQGDFCE
ncbi:MAG: aminopeptidase [Candidatus Pristimantibacillus sp.]